MKRLVTLTACAIACFLIAGCAHVSKSSEYFNGFLVRLHIRSAPAQNPETSQICILDPAALAEESADKFSAAGENSPAVVVPETTHDFGKITEEKEFAHKFSIKNNGKSVLNIKKVLPG